jgi:Fe-Mn family superoxide dismutase
MHDWAKIAKRVAASEGPIILPYREIPGLISVRYLEEHYKLYRGYWDMLTRVEQSIPDAIYPHSPAPDNPFRALKLAESYAIGGVLLHEMYFENIGPNHTVPTPGSSLYAAIIKKWGNLETWGRELYGTAMAARGWAIMAACEINPENITIFMADSHDSGLSPGYSILTTVDCFEHSYWGNHGTDKAGYLNAVIRALNWPILEKRYQSLVSSASARMTIETV